MIAALEGGEWSAARPGRTYSILQEAGWAPEPVWTCEKSRPHRDSMPDRSARSQSLYQLSYPIHGSGTVKKIKHESLLRFANVRILHVKHADLANMVKRRYVNKKLAPKHVEL